MYWDNIHNQRINALNGLTLQQSQNLHKWEFCSFRLSHNKKACVL